MSVRPATSDDLPAIAELFGSVEEAVLGRPSLLDATAVAGWLHGVAFETNTWLVEEGGELVAGAFGRTFGERGNSAGAVRPTAWGLGHGTRLLERLEARFAEEDVQRIHAWTVAGDEAANELFLGRGYREVRRFWDMAIDLGEEPPPEAAVPVEPFREEDARAFHAALEEAFSAHWEHSPETFEEWWERQRARPNFDPSVWFMIRDGGEIAGATRNDPDVAGGGYVGALGVRPAWRGRGYGRALLLHSFREFHRRGFRRVTLGVDAANATGATQLYESVGMHVDLESVVWEKMLSP
ncbi:MAG TPA: GNAT family N-acetyltransferase [Gaiellaceae bacterium]|nr:GNAT family N-acetyltransferase [Gaiellaceae bacterium]